MARSPHRIKFEVRIPHVEISSTLRRLLDVQGRLSGIQRHSWVIAGVDSHPEKFGTTISVFQMLREDQGTSSRPFSTRLTFALGASNKKETTESLDKRATNLRSKCILVHTIG